LHPDFAWERGFGAGAKDENTNGRGIRAKAFDVETGASAGRVESVAESL